MYSVNQKNRNSLWTEASITILIIEVVEGTAMQRNGGAAHKGGVTGHVFVALHDNMATEAVAGYVTLRLKGR